MRSSSHRVSSGKIWLTSAIGAVAALALAGTAWSGEAADEVFSATARVLLPGSQKIQSFDISFVDPAIKRYVLGDRTNKSVDVINTDNNTIVTQLTATPAFAGATGNNDTSGPDGVMILHGTEVWAGDGDSTVKVINLASGSTTHVIHTGPSSDKRADEMCYDPVHNLVLVANNAADPAPFATLISAGTYTAIKRITFDGTNGAPNSNNGAEQCQWSGQTGKFYISIPGIVGQPDGTGGVAVIDPVAQKVEKTWIIPASACIAPQGMAIGPNNQILLGCNGGSAANSFSTVIINGNSGAIIAVLKNESGSDEVWYNEGDGQYFLARSAAGGSNQLLGVVDAVGHHEDTSVLTANKSIAGRNAHSVAADSNKNQVYVPIPAGVSTVCSGVSGNTADDAQGCIAVFTTTNDDRPRTVQDRQQDENQE